MKITAYAAAEPAATLRPIEYIAGQLGRTEVDVQVTHCGICHTDAGMIDNEFGISSYPCVAGHEVVGTIVALGTDVDTRRLQVGQRVGVGAICGSCMGCEWCEGGKQNVCSDRVDTVLRGLYGGFASHVRVADWRFAYPIPEAISSEQAGPLLCAGTTVFSPILRYGVRGTDRVAVVGIGGLGHLAIQYLAKWGCEVTAISTSSDKANDARRFGAARFVSSATPEDMARAAGTFDFILSTVPADLPWNDYLALLRLQGTLCIVGVPANSISLPAMGLIPSEKRVAGGIPGSPVETALMLDFSARHGINPLVQTFPVQEINAALDKVRKGEVRFRAVLRM